MDKLPLRLKSKIQVNGSTNCWEWVAVKDKHGYGRLHYERKTVFSHRIVYQLLRGTLPAELDHNCRNPACCNPNHLEGVTHKENVNRGISRDVTKSRFASHTHCPKGHMLSGDNLYAYKMKNEYINKQCRTCRRDSKRLRRASGARD